MNEPLTFPAETAGFLEQVNAELERIAEELEAVAAVVAGRAMREGDDR